MATQALVGPVRARPRHDTAALGDLRVPGVLLFVVGVAFITVTMLLASIVPAYDYRGAAVSDLGVIAESALWFNILLVTMGVLNITGGYLCYRSHRRLWLLALYLVAGTARWVRVCSRSTPADRYHLRADGVRLLQPRGAGHRAGGWSDARPRGYRRVVGLVYTVVMAIGDSEPGHLRADRARWHRTDDRLPGDAVAHRVRWLPDGSARRRLDVIAGGPRPVGGHRDRLDVLTRYTADLRCRWCRCWLGRRPARERPRTSRVSACR